MTSALLLPPLSPASAVPSLVFMLGLHFCFLQTSEASAYTHTHTHTLYLVSQAWGVWVQGALLSSLSSTESSLQPPFLYSFLFPSGLEVGATSGILVTGTHCAWQSPVEINKECDAEVTP